MTIRRGFTLIELMVVISIIAVLAGLLMPMVTLARKRSGETNTLALLRKVETGLELFKGELDSYPFQSHDTVASFPEADNRLGWVLAHDLTASEHADLQYDLTAARDAYRPGGSHEVTAAEVDPRISAGGLPMREIHAGMINRLATQRATMAVLAGNVGVYGIHNDSNNRILRNPRSNGYAFDFLSIDLNPGDLDGETLVDMWGRPIVYNCPVVQGVQGHAVPSRVGADYASSTGSDEPPIDPVHYGLHTRGRFIITDLASDRRTHAHASRHKAFEVWSAGYDGRIEPQRDHPVNRDNLAPSGYEEGLK